MKKIVTGVTLSAAVGLSLVAVATPASAVEAPQNCGELYDLGYSHVPAGHEWYLPKLDRNEDGIGCENAEGLPGLKRLDTPGANTSEGYHDPRDQALPDAAYTYPDCADAYAAGVFNIPAASEDYHDDLDSDQDGVACEYNVEYGVIVEGREQAAAAEIAVLVAAEQSVSEGEDEDDQVAVVPVGAADTGVAPAGDPAAALTLGTLGLAAVAGAAVVARRRVQA